MKSVWRLASILTMALLCATTALGCADKAPPAEGSANNTNNNDPGPEGQPEATPEGQPEGTPEGEPEGNPEGQPEGNPEGQPEGNPEGQPEGEPEPMDECGDGICQDSESEESCALDCDLGPYCDPNNVELCDDNIDNDCDAQVDEGCTCTVAEKPCYSGDPRDLEGGSSCRAGTQLCEREFYGVCMNEVLPSEEVCDGVDNDCDDEVDEIEGCNNTPPLAICPPDQTGPTLAFYEIVGGYEDADGDAMVRSVWSLLDKPVGSTARPTPANQLTTEIFADVQGIYLFQLEVEDNRGGIGRCVTTVVTNSQDQLRIEMVWNVGANNDRSDVDLHLIKTPGARYFANGPRGDDCFWENCRLCTESYNQAPETYEANCRQQIADFNNDPNSAPPPQVEWFSPLDDNDPRLDLDDVEGNGPENINVRSPLNGTYRLGVHYWADDGFGDSTVSLRIFCRGQLAREFEPVVLREKPGADGGPDTEFWEVADIVWTSNGCQIRDFGAVGCREICTRREVDTNLGCPDNMSRGQVCQ